MTQEVLKKALEALEGADWYINQLELIVYSVDDEGTHENRAKVQSAITALREALAQPPVAKPHEQEPVVWGVDWGHAGEIPCASIIKRLPDGAIQVLAVEYAPYAYNPPPAATQHERTWVNATTWRGLTDDEALECWPGLAMYADCAKFWENIEAKLKAKNENI